MNLNKKTETKSLQFILVVFLIYLGAACTDLEETPDYINPSSFYKSANELELGVNAIYDDLTMGNGDWFNFFYNRYVFECIIGYQIGWEKQPLQYNLGNVTAQDDVIEAYWGQCYRSIYRANAILEIADDINDPANADRIARLKGEAHFLRGFYYYSLLSYFDNVPLVTSTSGGLESLPSNSGGIEAIINQIYEDCDAAIDVLPTSYTGANLGRATSWAAKTLLMKTQLWDKDWAGAKVTAEDIMGGGIELFGDFSFNFDIDHENMGERIFEGQVSASANANEYSNHSAHFNPEDLPTSLGGAGWSWLSASQEFRASYDDNDERIAGTFMESYPTGRTALNSAGEFPIVRWSADAPYNLSRFGGVVDPNADPDDPAELIFGKAWSAKITEINPGGSWTNTEKNTVYMRYADVLLGHSEACNESQTGDPYLGINEVRDRAGLAPLAGLSQAELRDAIVDERIYEFAFEQVLYPELRRKSTFGGTPDYLGDRINRFIETYGVSRTLKAKDYVLPIPLKEILGNPNVTQNPVWQ